MIFDIKNDIKKYIISEFSKITYIDECEIKDNSFLYSNLSLDMLDILSIIIQVENKFGIYVDEDKIDLYNDISLHDFIDMILKVSGHDKIICV